MILGFKEQFISKCLDGSKKHSFRVGKRWKPGMSIQFYTKVRQPGMYKFMPDGICKSVQDVKLINHPSSCIMVVDTIYIFHFVHIEVIAKNDGFDGCYDFIDFFFPKNTFGEVELQLVHWTDLEYNYKTLKPIR